MIRGSAAFDSLGPSRQSQKGFSIVLKIRIPIQNRDGPDSSEIIRDIGVFRDQKRRP